MTDPTPPRASEGGHWYDPKTGCPVYQVPSADGKKKIDCTLRQARKLGLVPGTTGPIKMLAAPELVKWIVDQTIKAALKLTREPGETDEAFAARIKAEAEKIAENARNEGTAIHAAIKQHYSGQPFDPTYAPHVKAAVDEVERHYPGCRWRSEEVAVTAKYGTAIDLWTPDNGGIIIDFKGKEFDADEADGMRTYTQHWMQLAAGDNAISGAKGIPINQHAICYVSRSVPGLATMVPLNKGQVNRGMAMFFAANVLWQNDRDYYPGE